VIQGISEAAQSVSYAAMAERQQQLARAILKDPDVESLSSFIGVDGTNTTLNSGRFLINLKPHDERSANHAPRSSAGCSRRRASVAGHHAVHAAGAGPDHRLRHRQPHAVPVHPGGRRPASSTTWVPKLVDKLRSCRSSPTSPATCRTTGCGLSSHRPRHRRALRHHAGDGRQRALRRLRPAHRLDHLHQSNQYRVILRPIRSLQTSLIRSIALPAVGGGGGQVPLSAIAKVHERKPRRCRSIIWPVPGHHRLVQPGAGRVARRAVDAIKQAQKDIGLPASVHAPPSRARRWRSSRRCPTSCADPGRDRHVYIVLGVLYESFIHPITILSTLPSAGIGALLALMIGGTTSTSSASSASSC
jgi:multidrug efflux pump